MKVYYSILFNRLFIADIGYVMDGKVHVISENGDLLLWKLKNVKLMTELGDL